MTEKIKKVPTDYDYKVELTSKEYNAVIEALAQAMDEYPNVVKYHELYQTLKGEKE